MNLYSLSQQYIELKSIMEDTEDETYLDTLEAIQGTAEEKILEIVKLMKELEYEAEVIKTEEKRLANRRKAKEKAHDRLKFYIYYSMKDMDLKRIETALFNLNIQNNPPSVQEINPALIPHELYDRETSNLDKKETLKRIKIGEEIIGVEITKSESLHIR